MQNDQHIEYKLIWRHSNTKQIDRINKDKKLMMKELPLELRIDLTR